METNHIPKTKEKTQPTEGNQQSVPNNSENEKTYPIPHWERNYKLSACAWGGTALLMHTDGQTTVRVNRFPLRANEE